MIDTFVNQIVFTFSCSLLPFLTLSLSLSLLSFIFSLLRFISIKISIESNCISWVTLLCTKDMHSKFSSWDIKWPFWISFQSIKNSRYASVVHCFIKYKSSVFKNEVTTYLHCKISAVVRLLNFIILLIQKQLTCVNNIKCKAIKSSHAFTITYSTHTYCIFVDTIMWGTSNTSFTFVYNTKNILQFYDL